MHIIVFAHHHVYLAYVPTCLRTTTAHNYRYCIPRDNYCSGVTIRYVGIDHRYKTNIIMTRKSPRRDHIFIYNVLGLSERGCYYSTRGHESAHDV